MSAMFHIPLPSRFHWSRNLISSYSAQKDCSYTGIMAQPAASNSGKKVIQIDISSDTVCPWCFVGKRNLDKAIAASKDQYEFEIKWHPFQLEPSAPKEGVNKREFYKKKFGSRADGMEAHMAQTFQTVGLQYNMNGLTGNTLESHRLVHFAGKQGGSDKQHKLVEELFIGYFTQEKYIGDRKFLLESANKVGVEGAAEFLEVPDNGVKEVKEELEKFSSYISGVPHYTINGKQKLSGAQPSEAFLRAFHASAK